MNKVSFIFSNPFYSKITFLVNFFFGDSNTFSFSISLPSLPLLHFLSHSLFLYLSISLSLSFPLLLFFSLCFSPSLSFFFHSHFSRHSLSLSLPLSLPSVLGLFPFTLSLKIPPSLSKQTAQKFPFLSLCQPLPPLSSFPCHVPLLSALQNPPPSFLTFGTLE